MGGAGVASGDIGDRSKQSRRLCVINRSAPSVCGAVAGGIPPLASHVAGGIPPLASQQPTLFTKS